MTAQRIIFTSTTSTIPPIWQTGSNPLSFPQPFVPFIPLCLPLFTSALAPHLVPCLSQLSPLFHFLPTLLQCSHSSPPHLLSPPSYALWTGTLKSKASVQFFARIFAWIFAWIFARIFAWIFAWIFARIFAWIFARIFARISARIFRGFFFTIEKLTKKKILQKSTAGFLADFPKIQSQPLSQPASQPSRPFNQSADWPGQPTSQPPSQSG